ncbi:metal ABC transporter ATP-binding protein [Pseudogracilibacillus auburnensis]|uniref:Iron/zinc/copper transport system ATP-binding protein n=1 Tax=Pseudogracilibacillus auburnensis TaxID=1494959 RepID=A0A2V3W4S9_9BACI|nr:metal ABC transporter ATP-binding protein [Pseudogracilibacillus auburnensis]MBO1004878.1 metal ABC transporter ATP-binding protein [Pseudogracilibacillus auburnensis]PXW88051.1 iron/zinc/copper transport system ATP-binding protein [Pseudogracilibacillus auburnensis]
MKGTIDVKNLSVSYYGNEVVRDVSFSFKTGNLIGIVGPNGAGKSTMMKAALGLIPKDSGTVVICDQPIHNLRKKIAYVPQRSNIDWDFPIIVKDTVLLGTFPNLGLFKRPKKEEKELAAQCLEKVGMQEFSNRQIAELSGGQQQRVFLARALAQKADFFFLDEPFVGIDVASEEIIINILKDLRNAGKTIFVVHHDLSKVENYFDDLILINKELYGAGPVQQVFQTENMERCFKMKLALSQGLGVGV